MTSPAGNKRASDAADAGNEQPATKRFKYTDYTEIITVAVGKSKKNFPVYKSIICAKAPFFEAACKKEWSKEKDRVVNLAGVFPSTFTQFLHWLYSGTISLEVLKDYQELAYLAYFTQLSVLGDFLGMPDFCNQVMDCAIEEIRTRTKTMPHVSAVELAPGGSAIRRFLIDHVAAHGDGKYLLHAGHNWPQDFIVETLAAKYNDERRASLSPLQQEKCHYHIHAEGISKRP